MIKVLASGLFSTVQDLGRFGYRNLGVPVSGVMDRKSAKMANSLVGNAVDAAVLEFTASGPVLEFETKALVAISGASFSPKLDGEVKQLNEPFMVMPGSVLSFGTPKQGLRAYMAVAGGFRTENVLDSRSYFQGITKHTSLQKGDILPIESVINDEVPILSSELNAVIDYDLKELEVLEGPEFNSLPIAIRSTLGSGNYSVGKSSNRMAYVLEHSEGVSANEINTGPVQPGTIQMTPSGKLLVMMRDAPTTGGYARVLQLSETAINQLAQKRSGANIRFKIIDPPFDTLF